MTTIRPAWGQVFLAPPNMTADELLRMNEQADDGTRYELFDGLLVREGIEMTSAGHAVLCQRLGLLLGNYAQSSGFANPIVQNMLFDLSPAGSSNRITLAPDVAKLRATTPVSWTGVPHDSPLLAIEILSPSQTTADLALESHAFLDAGAEEVWVIDHKARTVEVRTLQGTRPLDEKAPLTSALLPGFSVSVRFLLDG